MTRSARPNDYDGIPYAELPIETIEWDPEAAEHIRHRSAQKGQPAEFDVEPEWATEAALDANRVVADSGSDSGETIAVIGYSPAAGRVLTVILGPNRHPPQGDWWGATAYAANRKEEQGYRQHERESGETSAPRGGERLRRGGK